MLNLAGKLPDRMLDGANSLAKFMSTKITPSVSWSAGVVSPMSNLFGSKNSGDKDADLADKYGTELAVAQKLEALQATFIFAEDTAGANEEMRLCLKSLEDSDWMSCDDYEEYVVELVDAVRKRSHEATKLKVRAFFATTDAIIGRGGQEYFDRCWHEDKLAGALTYETETLPGTDHDSVLIDTRKGALKKVFEDVASISTLQ